MHFPNLLLAASVLTVACETMDPSTPGNLVPATVEEDARLPAIQLNGTLLHAETLGDPNNPAIVFLHGGPGGDYRGLLQLAERHAGYSLADDYFLVYWDQRGAGLSKRHDKDVLTLDQYTADLHAMIDRYSPGRPVFLVGASWGGMYATHYINEYPGRIAGAVLIEPGPLNGETYEAIEDDLFDVDLGAEWLNDWAWSSQFLTPDDHARMDYERMLGLKESQPRFGMQMDVNPEPLWRVGAAVSRYLPEDGQDDHGTAIYDFTDNLEQYGEPVLFLAGSKSEILGEAFQREQMQHYVRASLVVIEDAGHDLNWTHWIQTRELIRAYLDAQREEQP